MMSLIRICRKITLVIRKLFNTEMCECANIKPTLPKLLEAGEAGEQVKR